MQHEQNHVLLIRLDEKMSSVLNTLVEMRQGISGKADQKDLEDFAERTDKRIEAIEKGFGEVQRKVWMIAGGLVVIEFVLRFAK